MTTITTPVTTITDIATRLATNDVTTGLTAKQIKAIVSATIAEIATAVTNKEKVRLHNLGTFSSREYAARNGINPKTLTPLVIPAMHRVKFKAASSVAVILKAA
jgi:DNA-binding protein HU-beta